MLKKIVISLKLKCTTITEALYRFHIDSILFSENIKGSFRRLDFLEKCLKDRKHILSSFVFGQGLINSVTNVYIDDIMIDRD